MSLRTKIYTLLNGVLVGLDEFGNKYYRGKGRKLNGRERRWVVYLNNEEASNIPPEWHAWLHHTVEEPLVEEAVEAKNWQSVHKPNLTGTEHSYRPKGHIYQGGKRSPATGDYSAWVPD